MANEHYINEDGYIVDIEEDINREAIANLKLERMIADARIKAARFYVEQINSYAGKLKILSERIQHLYKEIEKWEEVTYTKKEEYEKIIHQCDKDIEIKRIETEEYIATSECTIRQYKHMVASDKKKAEETQQLLSSYTADLNKVKSKLEQAQTALDKVLKANLEPVEKRVAVLKLFIEEFEEREKHRTRITFKDGAEMVVKAGTRFKPNYQSSNRYLKVNLYSTNMQIVREYSPSVFKACQVGYANIIAEAEDGSKSCIFIRVVK